MYIYIYVCIYIYIIYKGFKAIQNVLSKYDAVFFNFIFGQTESWK